MNTYWLSQSFKNDGHVIDAYISEKARRRAKVKFEFVRFSKEFEAAQAMERNNRLQIKGLRMSIN